MNNPYSQEIEHDKKNDADSAHSDQRYLVVLSKEPDPFIPISLLTPGPRP